jgi:hypothetical protein
MLIDMKIGSEDVIGKVEIVKVEESNRFEEILSAQKGLVNILETHLRPDVFEKVLEDYRKTVMSHDENLNNRDCSCGFETIRIEPIMESSNTYSTNNCIVLGVCENPECKIRNVTWTIEEHMINLYRRELN